MDEAGARQIVLAQAIESTDTQGRLVSAVERAQIDRRGIEAARTVGPAGSAESIGQFLRTRAVLLLEIAGQRDRPLASLQQSGSAERWVTAGLPLAALVLGVFTDQVANPHQVNLLSKPLLLLLLWNALVYAVLFGNLLLPRREQPRLSRVAGLWRWISGLREGGWRPGQLRSDVIASFLLRWHAATAALYGQRLARVLHLAAAAWALGVALSLFFGGVWASYGVQWESTFLSADAVHTFLGALFKPVTALFPWASFSLEEVRGLRAPGPLPPLADSGDNFTGRRWVFLYAMLLALVVVVPRLVLAGVAWWRERTLSRNVRLDVSEAYYQRLIAALSPARVQLCLVAHRGEDRASLLRVLLHRVDGSLPGIGLGQGQVHELLKASGGEVLCVLDLPPTAEPASLPKKRSAPSRGWTDRLFAAVSGKAPESVSAAENALYAAREESDVVLHVVSSASDLDAAAGLLQWLDKPVLILVSASGDEAPREDLLADCKALVREGSRVAAVLGFDQFARCWVQERVLLDAVAGSLPDYKAAGFDRLLAAWDERNLAHLRESMLILAGHLLAAARQVEDVGQTPRSWLSLVSPGERDAHERASREAMACVVQRLQRSDAQATAQLLVLHDIGASSAAVLNQQMEEKFVVQHAISATQAGMAGAATGAALGVSIDLLTAGLTLGLAAAAGAVVGGGAAWVAAVWRNQATPAGTSVVQLSDEMMQAMVEAALLRYLAVIHFGRGPSGTGVNELRPEWRSEVVAAVAARSSDLNQQWAAARARQAVLDPAAPVVALLETLALGVLKRLYPAAKRP